MKQLTEQIRNEIKEQLSKVNKSNAPKLYEVIQTENGYKGIEEKIIKMMIQNNFTVSSCIPHLENTL